MTVREAVQIRINELCLEHDLTVNGLSMISGVTQSTVQNIMSGRNHSTTVSTIKKLCDGLGISIVDFFQHEIFSDLEQEIQ